MPKRHLPLLQASADGETDSDDPRRPAWQWVGFGTLAIFAVWVPLSALAGALATRVIGHVQAGDATSDPVALGGAVLLANALYALGLAVGALAGGYLVARWGPAAVGVWHAALSGLAAVAVLAVVMGVSLGLSPGVVPVAILAPLAAALGGRLGRRGRGRRSS